MNHPIIVVVLLATIIVISFMLMIKFAHKYANCYIKENKKELRKTDLEMANRIRAQATMLANDFNEYEDAVKKLGFNQVYSCSSVIVSGAINNKTQYVIKYSDIEYNIDSLRLIDHCIVYENTLNSFRMNVDSIRYSIRDSLPFIVRVFSDKEMMPFWVCGVDSSFYSIKLPFFRFSYVSPLGRSSHEKTIIIDVPLLEEISNELKGKLNKNEHIKRQRKAMTNDLRAAIKKRDNYTCCICGNSVYNEPNLLLEVDHIIPVSKGGKTEASNLQTLCWRCNREKSNKI